MADVTIDGAINGAINEMAQRGGIFWTSPTVGYVIYIKGGTVPLVYQKTGNGGATWGGVVEIKAGAVIRSFDCWADWQTAGDAGTKIHIAYISADTDDVRYVYLDTNGDSLGGDTQIEAGQGTGSIYLSLGRDVHYASITKTRGGNLAVAFRYRDDSTANFYGFYTSSNGVDWVSKNTPWESQRYDYLLLFPGNEADNQDVWGTFWDASANAISLKTYDDSGNSWSEQAIAGSMRETADYLHMDGVIRLSDGHLIFSAWSRLDYITSDLMVWDINGAGSITPKTNVITDTLETFTVSVFVNQINDDIYIAYATGTARGSLVKVVYQLSQNGGANWDGEAAMQVDAEEDMRWVSAGAMKSAWGGKFQPVWFDDDDLDLFTSSDSGISIEVEVGGVNYPISLSPGLTAVAIIDRDVAWGRSLSPGLTISATIVAVFGRLITTIANLAASATVDRKVAYKRASSSGLTTAISVLKGWGRTIATTAGLTVSATVLKGWGRTIATTSNLTVSVAVAKTRGFFKSVVSNLTASTVITRKVAYYRTVPVRIDSTWQVTASADDCLRDQTEDIWSTSEANFIAGHDDWYTVAHYVGSAARFLNINIAAGSTIIAANLILTARRTVSATPVNTRLRAELNVNPAIFSTKGNFDARTWTTEFVNWDAIVTWSSGVEYTSPDFKDVIQEVADLGGITHLAILWDDFQERSTHTDYRCRTAYSYDDSTTKCPQLVIKYTVGGGLTASATIDRAVTYTRAIQVGLTLAVTILKGWGRTIATTSNLTVSATILKGWGRKIATSTGLTASVSIVRTIAYSRAVTAGLSIIAPIITTLVGAIYYGAAVLSGVGTLVVSGVTILVGSATLSGAGTLTASGFIVKVIEITLALYGRAITATLYTRSLTTTLYSRTLNAVLYGRDFIASLPSKITTLKLRIK